MNVTGIIFNNLKELAKPMEQEIIGSWSAPCPRHKRDRVTHICTEEKCLNNPFLCSQCFTENVNLSYHYDHEPSILGIPQAVEKLGASIKAQTASANKVFKGSLARGEHLNLLQQIEKGAWAQEELQQRIGTIKGQVELELELLVKEFQKAMLLEKQEYFRLLDAYQRTYSRNMEYIRAQVQPLLDFQTGIRYYANPNNLYMKTITEARKKTDWLTRTKKTLLSLSKLLEPGATYASDLNTLLGVASRAKLDIWPAWKGEESTDKASDLKYIIKRAMNQWAYIPDLKPLGEGSSLELGSNGHGGLSKNYYSSSGGK